MQDNWATTGVASGGGMQSIRKLVQVPYLQNIGRGTFAKQAPTLINCWILFRNKYRIM